MAFSFIRRITKLGRAASSAGRRRRTAARVRPCIEGFEERCVPALISWVNPAGGNWEDAKNWNGGVPGPKDDVVIDVPGNVTVTHAIGKDTIQSLVLGDTLTLNQNSSLAISGSFSRAKAAKEPKVAADEKAGFTVQGDVALDGLQLSALGGGQISLLKTRNTNITDVYAFRASGAGSRIDLPNWLGAVSDPSSTASQFTVDNGGVISAPNLVQLQGAFQFGADGQGSAIDLASYRAGYNNSGSNNQFSGYRVSNGGVISLPNLAQLQGAFQFTADGQGSEIDLPSFRTGYNNTGSNNQFIGYRASNGGVISLPNLVQLQGAFQFAADGQGSEISLPGYRAGYNNSGNNNQFMGYRASNGGGISAPMLTQLQGAFQIDAEGAGSQIDFSALTTFTGLTLFNGGAVSQSTLQAHVKGIILGSPEYLTVTDVAVGLDGTSKLACGTLDLEGTSVLTGSGTLPGNLVNNADVDLDGLPDVMVVAGNYTQTTGRAQGPGTLQVNGLFTWGGGELDQLRMVSGGGINIPQVDTTRVQRAGTIIVTKDWSNTSEFFSWRMADGAVLQIQPGVTVQFLANAALEDGGGSPSSIINNGRVEVGKRALWGIGGNLKLQNNGTLEVADGATVSLAGSLANLSEGTLRGGKFLIGGTLQLSGQVMRKSISVIVLNDADARIVDPKGNNLLAALTDNTAGASLTLRNGAQLVLTGDLQNEGQLAVQSGSTLSGRGTLTNGRGGSIYVAGGLTSGTLVFHQFQGLPGSLLTIGVGGTMPGQFGQIKVDGLAQLGGALWVFPTPGVHPHPGDRIPILTYGQHTGQFDPFKSHPLDGGLNFFPLYEDTGLTLVVAAKSGTA
jgi:hypothetical protein